MKWVEPNATDVPEDLRTFVGGHPLIAERLFHLGLTSISSAQAFLDRTKYSPASPFELPDLEHAVKRLKRAIASSERILIWGDFDVDGQTATSVLFDGLRQLGADVRYHVPLRQGEGHGIQLAKLESWLTRGIDVIVSCDTGITAHDAVAVAQAAGVDVVITDHHILGDSLPPALAVINPLRLPTGHPLHDLPGVGVAWELISALVTEDKARELLDLVALGIVSDVAIQTRDTRYLLQGGLEQMRVGVRVGLRALFERADIDVATLSEDDIGFSLGPRLNAQGRLGDAAVNVELLTTNDRARAAELANQLEGMNVKRKQETQLVMDSAMTLIESDPSVTSYAAIVLSHPEWQGGIVGIVANRLAEKFRKPVVLLNEKGHSASGSARSVPGCNITDAISRNRDIVGRFGGHAMAAGLSIKRDDVSEFRRRLSRTVREMTSTAVDPESGLEPGPELEIDAYVTPDELTKDLAQDIARLAPFGNGNRRINLATRRVELVRRTKARSRAGHVDLTVKDETGKKMRLFWRGAGEALLPGGRFDIAYNISADRSKDRKDFALTVVDFRACEDDVIEVANRTSTCVFEDLSASPDRVARLNEITAQGTDYVVWRELRSDITGSTRSELHRAELLVVWTAPAGPDEWQRALKEVRPRRIAYIGEVPAPMNVESFLRRLAGLAKHVLKGDGESSIAAFAGATAQRDTAVRYGLRWLEESGAFELDVASDGTVIVSRSTGGVGSGDEKGRLEVLIAQILEETRAFRARGAALLNV
jgi:single-stranded-DNA-specific exonuclease